VVRLIVLGLAVGLVCLPADVGSARQTARLILLLASDQASYAPGMPVSFTLAVDNPEADPVTFTFRSSQLYDIVVMSGDAEVWRHSADKFYAAVLRDRTFAPGVTLLGRETWDWRDGSGAALPPGTYRAVGSLPTQPTMMGNPIEIVLQGP